MSTPVRATAASLRVFLERIIDYAGLFPPASLDMTTSVNNYSRYLSTIRSAGRWDASCFRLRGWMNF